MRLRSLPLVTGFLPDDAAFALAMAHEQATVRQMMQTLAQHRCNA